MLHTTRWNPSDSCSLYLLVSSVWICILRLRTPQVVGCCLTACWVLGSIISLQLATSLEAKTFQPPDSWIKNPPLQQIAILLHQSQILICFLHPLPQCFIATATVLAASISSLSVDCAFDLHFCITPQLTSLLSPQGAHAQPARHTLSSWKVWLFETAAAPD